MPTSLATHVSMLYFVDLVFTDINKSLLCMSLKDFFKGKCFETVPNFLKWERAPAETWVAWPCGILGAVQRWRCCLWNTWQARAAVYLSSMGKHDRNWTGGRVQVFLQVLDLNPNVCCDHDGDLLLSSRHWAAALNAQQCCRGNAALFGAVRRVD